MKRKIRGDRGRPYDTKESPEGEDYLKAKGIRDESGEIGSGRKKPCHGVKFISTSIFDEDRRTAEIDLTCYDESRINLNLPEILLNKRKFSDTQIFPAIVRYLEERLNIRRMTEIQATCLPCLAKGRDNDILIQACTGSGKTLAFVVPIIDLIIKGSVELEGSGKELSRASGVLCIILSPTRELAYQLYSVVQDLVNNISNPKFAVGRRLKHWIVSGILSSGSKKKGEKAVLRRGIQILVSTPGRLLDHLRSTASLKIHTLRWLVLDEADLLLQLGLLETVLDIKSIINRSFEIGGSDPYGASPFFPKKCINVMCSATLSNMRGLIAETLNDPLLISPLGKKADPSGDHNMEQRSTLKDSVSRTVKQHFIVSPAKQRLVCLVGLLKMILRVAATRNYISRGGRGPKAIVFFSTCDSVDNYFNVLTQHSRNNEQSADGLCFSGLSDILETKVFRLHGKLTPGDRGSTFQEFINYPGATLLFTTDLSERGLDIGGVVSIVQYDLPQTTKGYVHRIGRTARMGEHGDAWTFLFESEVEYVNLIKSEIGDDSDITQVRPETLFSELLPVKGRDKGISYRSVAINLQKSLEKFVNDSSEDLELAHRALTSFMRAYASHKNKSIFGLKRLHMGHLAKSFGLACAPTGLSSIIKRDVSTVAKRDEPSKKKTASYVPISRHLVSSVAEFGDGLT